MGLDEDAVDLLEINGADLVAHRFDQRAEAQIAGAPQQAFGGTDDEGQGLQAERVVAQAGSVELSQDEGLRGLGSQAGQEDRIGDPGADFFIDR